MPVHKGLENYKLVEKMGDGAFSNVYKAIDIRTGQKVAVKVVRKYELSATQAGDKHLNKEFKKKPRVTERSNILKEVQIMRGITHPSIVKLLLFFESEEHYFLVLELMEGGELFHQIVKMTYFSENLARHVILQVAEGIRYLHEERGVVHRDIKPENLLFHRIPIVPSKNPQPNQYGDESKEDEGVFIPGVGGGGIGRVKIADFGLSKVVWDEQTMTPCGTVGYTAPEIVRDERYSKSVDMWALGCVLYTLLCGFPPFYDEKIDELTRKVAMGHYTFLSPWWDPISATAKDLITHLLCVDPAQRYTIDEFLGHPWCKASAAPMPPPTPGLPLRTMPLDSPLLAEVRGNGREARSPGIATLKEAFDITYAVHRMEEEGARKRAAKGGANRGFLGGLNEEDEDSSQDEDADVVNQAKQRHAVDGRIDGHTSRSQQPQAPVGAGAKVTAKRALHGGTQLRAHVPKAGGTKKIGTSTFELDMDNATLLGRRHKRGGVGDGSPLAQKSPVVQRSLPQDPGSPMRID
ncbi:kinase-like domain-containing protein [Cytidiella melzeri]|nr:kinase-like domain-containing protein [Cytidiella melzeri]